jgi:hypothetical protein
MSGYCEGTGLYPIGCCMGNNNNNNGNTNGSTAFLWSNYETTVFTESNVNIGFSNNPFKLAVNGSIFTPDSILSTGCVNNSLVNANSLLQNANIMNALINYAKIDELLVSKITMLNLLGKQVFANMKKASESPTVSTKISWENANNVADQKFLTVKIGQNLSTTDANGSRTLTYDINTFLNPILTWKESHSKGTGSFDIYKNFSINIIQTPTSMTFQSTTNITDIKSHTISLDILSIPVGLGNITII